MQTIINNLDVIAFIGLSAVAIGCFLKWNSKAWGEAKLVYRPKWTIVD